MVAGSCLSLLALWNWFAGAAAARVCGVEPAKNVT